MEASPSKPDILQTQDLLINMGPQHPSTHGVLRVIVTSEGEIVKAAQPEMGYLHRCMEKHAENIDYMGVAPFCDRLDYLGSQNMSGTFAMAVEKLVGIEVPERAQYIRVIVWELNRLASHLLAFGTYGLDVGAFTPFLWAFREREKILDFMEAICGARLLYNYCWVGGVMNDLKPEIVQKIKNFLPYFKKRIAEYNELLTFNSIFMQRTVNVGVISLEQAFEYGFTGPNLRASGFNWDLRKNEPYSVYPKFNFEVPVSNGQHGSVVGDCWSRYYIRMLEMEESIKIIEQAIEALPEGPFRGNVPKVIKAPKGAECYVRAECPRGELGYYLVSDGGDGPYRCRVRSSSFAHVACLDEVSRGVMLADLVMIIGSIDIVLGEVDR